MSAVTLQALGVGVAILGFWGGLLLWGVRGMLRASQEHLDERFARLDAWTRRTESLERDVLDIRRELARDYVRREDWIRFGTTVTTKLDALWAQLDALKERLNAVRHRPEKIDD